ncbi:hypothetical protein [Sphaerotilus mobilis]|uniref:Uncharacterized protein n=1 Tax=Sphaerotilus mobilis TaxID=47994 RepID=A0A4Q7LB99_9BURK|nr:hypothetical protein [Sphaerotilus mobilis]RZS47427.1 hypothetical protein EV685_3631 [Sphaerotilus mobilis]
MAADLPPSDARDTRAAMPESGYSYFVGVAVQRLSYEEYASTLPVRSKAVVNNPLLVSGALYALAPDVLFSLDNETSFAPVSGRETWTAPVGTRFPVTGQPDIVTTVPVVQTNGVRISDSTTRLLGQIRLRGPWFVSTGPAFHSQSFRRYSFAAGVDQAVDVATGETIEETSAELLWHLGLGYESERVRGTPVHLAGRVGVAVPVWRKVENTAHPGVIFGNTRGGYDLGIEGRASIAVFDHVHLGLWGRLQTSARPVDQQGKLELPRTRQGNRSIGVEFLWKL